MDRLGNEREDFEKSLNLYDEFCNFIGSLTDDEIEKIINYSKTDCSISNEDRFRKTLYEINSKYSK